MYQGFYYLLRNWLRRHGNRGLLARSRTWPHVKISLFFFGVLFVIPGICNLINGTLLSKNVQTSTVGTPVRVLGFLEDWGIVLIATVLWPAHAAVMYGVLTRVSNALRDLTRSKILLINASDYSKFVRNYNDWANAGWLAFGIILVSAIYTGYVYASRQGAWWGQLQYGLLGFMAYLWLTFITIHQIVMYVCKGLAGVLLTWDVLTRRRVVLDLQPYHQDGVHGIAELGRIQFLIWVGNFILTIFLFVLPASGVVELKPGFILLFAVVYLIILPVVAYFPVRLIREQMRRYKSQELQKINVALEARRRLITRKLKHTRQAISEYDAAVLERLEHAHAVIENMKEYPFPRLSGLLILVTYMVQIAGLAISLYRAFFGF